MYFVDYLIIIGLITLSLTIVVIIIGLPILFTIDRSQKQHPVLRNFPILGRVRYFLESIGPEMRQYWFNNDTEGKPFPRVEFENVVKSAKYQQNILGFGSQRDFEKEGYYISNAMFPKQTNELKMDMETMVSTKKYILLHESLFGRRKEKLEVSNSLAYLLHDDDAVVIGPKTKHPFVVKSLFGQSAMSYGSLGDRAITALSEGLGIAKGTWMNTGEGGLSPYHLKGDVDIFQQIGSALFGFRDKDGNFDWDELKKKVIWEELKLLS